MRYLSLVLLLAYLALLTFALLSPDPFLVAGKPAPYWKRLYLEYLEPVGHLLAFMPLGTLACLGNWPLRRPARLGLLASYSFASEGLQHFIPSRTVSLSDAVQNIAGLLAGAALWWVANFLLQRRKAHAITTS
jgi:VanZ family protein